MRAPHVQARATIRIAPANANWAGVPQIPSGMANSTARATATAPARAVWIHRAVNRAQQGTAISRPMRMRRLPSRVSMTDTASATEILDSQRRSEDQPHGVRSSLLRDDSEPPSGVGLPRFTGPSGDAIQPSLVRYSSQNTAGERLWTWTCCGHGRVPTGPAVCVALMQWQAGLPRMLRSRQ